MGNPGTAAWRTTLLLLSLLHLNEHFAGRQHHVPWNGYFQFKSWPLGQNKKHITENFGFVFLEVIPHFIPNQANTCQDLNQKFQSALLCPQIQSNGQDFYLRHGKFRLNLILFVRLFIFYHMPSICLVLQVIRAQFPHSLVHTTELCGKYWTTAWRRNWIMSHTPSMSYLSVHVLLPTFFQYLHINNGWHSTTRSPWGRSACKYPLALHFITCPQKTGMGGGGEEVETPAQEEKVVKTWSSTFLLDWLWSKLQRCLTPFYSSSIKQQNARYPASSDT